MSTEQERAAFEAFASKHGLCVTEGGDLYRSHVVAWMWKAWQARAAIEADRKRRGEPVAWQPIETAPKDGTTILVYFRQHGAMTVCWGDRDYDHTSEYATWLVEDHKHGPYPVRGYSKGDDTHWMPLPSAPQPAEPVKVPSDTISVVGVPEFDALMDHIYENGTASEGVLPLANALARAIIEADRQRRIEGEGE